jgi:hypothetical protein
MGVEEVETLYQKQASSLIEFVKKGQSGFFCVLYDWAI